MQALIAILIHMFTYVIKDGPRTKCIISFINISRENKVLSNQGQQYLNMLFKTRKIIVKNSTMNNVSKI